MHENCVEALFPMSDEIESTEWKPGVIALVPLEADVSALSFNFKDILSEVPVEVVERMSCLVPVLLFPFDFTRMEPVSETRHKTVPLVAHHDQTVFRKLFSVHVLSIQKGSVYWYVCF